MIILVLSRPIAIVTRYISCDANKNRIYSVPRRIYILIHFLFHISAMEVINLEAVYTFLTFAARLNALLALASSPYRLPKMQFQNSFPTMHCKVYHLPSPLIHLPALIRP